MTANTHDKEAWKQALRKKNSQYQLTRCNSAKPSNSLSKGMGPNKASGHKGGISRQGSKRG